MTLTLLLVILVWHEQSYHHRHFKILVYLITISNPLYISKISKHFFSFEYARHIDHLKHYLTCIFSSPEQNLFAYNNLFAHKHQILCHPLHSALLMHWIRIQKRLPIIQKLSRFLAYSIVCILVMICSCGRKRCSRFQCFSRLADLGQGFALLFYGSDVLL